MGNGFAFVIGPIWFGRRRVLDMLQSALGSAGCRAGGAPGGGWGSSRSLKANAGGDGGFGGRGIF